MSLPGQPNGVLFFRYRPRFQLDPAFAKGAPIDIATPYPVAQDLVLVIPPDSRLKLQRSGALSLLPFRDGHHSTG